MFKKLFVTFSAAILMIGGISSASATNTDITQLNINVAQGSISSMPVSAVIINNSNMLPQWTITTSQNTWLPSVTTFASSTVYVGHLTLNAEPGYVFNNLTTSAITISGAGATGATITNAAVAAGANATSVTVDITFPATSSGAQQQQQQQMVSTATASNVTDTGMTVDFATLAAAHSGVTTWTVKVRDVTVSPYVLIGTYNVAGSSHSLTITGLSAGTQYNVFMGDPTFTCGNPPQAGCGYEPGLYVTTTGSAQNNQNAQAQALAAAQAAAAAVQAAITSARSTVASTISSGQALTADQLAKANFKVINSSSMASINAALAKLDPKSADFSKNVAAAIDQINYVDTYFTLKSPATVASLSNFGITTSTVAATLVNKELAAGGMSAYPNVVALKILVNKAQIIEDIASATDKKVVTSTDLVNAKLLPADYSNKASIVGALKRLGSTIKTVADLNNAVKTQEAIVLARTERTKAIVAKIAAGK